MKDKDNFLATVRENRRIAVDGYNKIYSKSLEDMRFVYDIDGAQWPDGLKSDIKLTANNLQKFMRIIRADARQNRPRLKVVPVDDFADVQKAELINGLIRQIEHLSDADIAYDTAYAQAIGGSIGYFRIITEFSDSHSFEQDIKIKRIQNPYTVHFDPSAKDFNRSDAQYCFIDEWMKKEDFEREYPGVDATSQGHDSQGQSYEGWFQPNKVRVAEYYWKKKVPFTLALIRRTMPDGHVITQAEELTDEIKGFIGQTNSEIIEERQSFKTEVKWAKVTANDILEETDWPTDQIPVIPVQGDEIVVDGETHLLSFHRGAQDMQRMLNFWLTKATKIMAKSPDAPFLLTPEQVEGHENMWSQPNALDRAYMLFNETNQGKPAREQPVAPPIGMLSMLQTMAAGIEDHLGQFDASKGAPSNERSGRAINTRIAQSAKGSFVFVDNYTRALIYANKILVSLIPKIYDTQRAVQIRGEDGSSELTAINSPTGDVNADNSPVIENDLSVGKFDLIETVAASSVSRRQEERQDLLEALQYAGPVAPALLPIIFELSDSPNSGKVTKIVNEFIKSIQQGQQEGQPQQ